MAEHAESDKRLALIVEKKLGKDLDALVGEPFLTELHAAHDAYGRALGITEAAKTAAPAPKVDAPLRGLHEAMGGYCLQLLAVASDDEAREADVAKALAPIDKFRATQRRSAEPVPPPPADAPLPGSTTPTVP